MPRGRRSNLKRKTKPRRRFAVRRPLRFRGNAQPIFTESYVLRVQSGNPLAVPYRLIANATGTLQVAMSDIPQVAQYSNLYQKYRILKAKFICLATWNSESSDMNSASYNQQNGLFNGGMSRLVYAVNNSPALAAPLSEGAVLAENGCKIVPGGPKILMSCRPVPNLLDANGIQLTQRGKYINFVAGDQQCPHFGINWAHTVPTIGNLPALNPWYEVYVKLTFQLADPR